MKINLISESGGQQAIRDYQNRTGDSYSPINRTFRRDANMARAMGAIRSGESGVVNRDVVDSGSAIGRGGGDGEGRGWAGANPFRASTLSKEISRQHRDSQKRFSRPHVREYGMRDPSDSYFKKPASVGFNPLPVKHGAAEWGAAPRGNVQPPLAPNVQPAFNPATAMSATRPINPTGSPIRRVIQRMPNGR